MHNRNGIAVLLMGALLPAVFLGGCGKAPAEPEVSIPDQALSSYQEILRAAPALDGEAAELADASLDYDANVAKYGNHEDWFAVVDLNEDTVPELITLSVVNFRWAPVSVYTYADGAAVLLEDPLDPEAHGTFEQRSTANGSYVTYLCPEHHIHSVWRGTDPMGNAVEENHGYVLEGTALNPVECAADDSEDLVYFSDIALENTTENVDAMK